VAVACFEDVALDGPNWNPKSVAGIDHKSTAGVSDSGSWLFFNEIRGGHDASLGLRRPCLESEEPGHVAGPVGMPPGVRLIGPEQLGHVTIA
jgi:hypothetical protein